MKRLFIVLLLLLLTGCGAGLPDETAASTQQPEEAPPVRVGILDSGISPQAAPYTDTGWNYLDESQATEDDAGHGTRIAELIHLGAPDAVLVPLKISGSGADTTSEIVIHAIYDAVDRFDCDVLCMAFSIPDSEALRDAVAYAEQRGVILISAAGNLGDTFKRDKLLYPAAYETVVGVGAVDEANEVAPYSQRSRSVFVTALGDSADGTQQGTSFAAARIAGICAGSRWSTPEAFRSALCLQAEDRGPTGYDTDYGWGVVAANWDDHA